MRKLFYLSSCTTCKRILHEWGVPETIQTQDIKSQLYTEEELEKMKTLAGSYEAIFSKRSMKYRAWDVKDKVKKDEDYKSFLLKDYTFLKRPALVYDDKIFIGNAKQTIEEGKQFVRKIEA